ncbi:hypothetical protein SteCoe_14083 [Stentor coeruleus]|uniref:P-type ATPase C-terminal domain-containing protein n=1 Tax=Stentor coeruleus TaxID=5963 RepID=A0A1R2C712_9CILI|nr:hypothetical protein SteCoe_14083 [Stentor coeruleus]
MAFFALEQDIPPEISLKYPNLYSAGQKNAYFGIKTFWSWIIYAFFNGTFIFWFSMTTIPGGISNDGHEPGLFFISTISFVLLMHIIHVKFLVICCFWNFYNIGAIFVSFFIFYGMVALINSDGVAFAIQPEFPGLFFLVLSFGKTWIIIILGSFIALIPDFITLCVRKIFFPTPNDKIIAFLKENKENMDRI